MTMEKIKLLIDTDFGDDTDDAAAFRLALTCGCLDITAVTTVFGDTKKRAEMVLEFLSLYGRHDIPVAAGHGKALIERAHSAGPEPIQYPVLKNRPKLLTNMPAEDLILQCVRDNPDLVILAMGAMTNLAMAFLREPELMRHVKILAMGGAFFDAKPEWNIACDPEAARLVMEQSENLIMMGLDVTKYLKISPQMLGSWKDRNDPVMNYFLEGVSLFQKTTGFPVTFHDVLLTAYLLDPEVVSLQRGDYTVELNGSLTRGTLVSLSNYYEIHSPEEGRLQFAAHVDAKRFFQILEQYF